MCELQERYIKLARAVQTLWPEAFGAACARCTRICCRPHMGEEIAESPWLSAIAGVEQPGFLARNSTHPVCAALGETGCMYVGAKPPFCYRFYCDALLDTIEDAPDLVNAVFLCHILSDVTGLTGNLDLLEVTSVDEHTDSVAAALTRGEEHLSLSRAMATAATAEDAYRLALLMVARIPSILTKAVSRRLEVISVQRAMPSGVAQTGAAV